MKQITNRIVIEPMLFGDYAIGVYDEDDLLVLDKKYFVRGYTPTLLSALAIQEDMYPDSKIYEYDIENRKEKLITQENKNDVQK